MITYDVISFDYVYLGDKITQNILNIVPDDYSKILINFINKPKNGFISDINRNPVASVPITNLSNIIYQNYDNISNFDSFTINCSYGYYFASKTDITININIITSNTIILKDQFIYDNTPIKDNIISTEQQRFVINYLSSSNITPIRDYYTNHLSKLEGSNIKNLDLRTVVMNNSKLLFDNPRFYNYFGSINYNIYRNYPIGSNQIFAYKNDYQYLRYDISRGTISNGTSISFFVCPRVQFPYHVS